MVAPTQQANGSALLAAPPLIAHPIQPQQHDRLLDDQRLVAAIADEETIRHRNLLLLATERVARAIPALPPLSAGSVCYDAPSGQFVVSGDRGGWATVDRSGAVRAHGPQLVVESSSAAGAAPGFVLAAVVRALRRAVGDGAGPALQSPSIGAHAPPLLVSLHSVSRADKRTGAKATVAVSGLACARGKELK
jgi:hypothetical protein